MKRLTGSTIGDYELGERLGAGGMGEVYAARHRATRAEVALKVLSPEAGEDEKARFQREGEAHAAVDRHPHVARVHTAGEAEGQAYLVMDLLRGGSLDDRLRHGPLPQDEAVRIGLDVARGVAHLHTHGVLHRDLKPENVLFDEHGAAKLVDFGIARTSDSQLTQSGAILGTPAYMAPEQTHGRREEIGPACDVYGLGGLLYALLTGQAPFVGSTAVAVMYQVSTTPPAPLSKLRPDVDPALERLVLSCLTKEPSARPDSAQALIASLERWQAGARSNSRGLAVWLTFGVLLLALFVAAGWALSETNGEGPPPPPQPGPQPAPPPDEDDEEPPAAVEPLGEPVISNHRLGNTSLAGGFLTSRTILVFDDACKLTRWRLPPDPTAPPERLAETILPQRFRHGRTMIRASGDAYFLGGRNSGFAYFKAGGQIYFHRDASVRAMVFNPARDAVWTARADRDGPALYSVENGRRLRSPLPLTGTPVDVALSPGGDRLAVLSGDKLRFSDPEDTPPVEGERLTVYRLSDGAEVFPSREHKMLGRCLTFDHDGATLLVGTALGEIRLFDAATGEQTGQLQDPELNDDLLLSRAQEGSIRSLVRGTDGERIYSISRGDLASEQRLVVWVGEEPEHRLELAHDAGELVLSPDGRRMIAPCDAGWLMRVELP